MASLAELLRKGRTMQTGKRAFPYYMLSGHRHPRGAFMPLPVCIAVAAVLAAVLIAGIAFRA